jgi:murein DD-endopeptidase MepM/ murein hydrolase activator NlpD
MTRREMSGYGNTIIVKGDDGYYTWYAHMSGFKVKVGDRVRQGDPIGYSGGAPGAPGAGTSTGPHLHFGISTNVAGAASKFIHPETVLPLPREKERVRLLKQGQRVQVTSPGEAIPRVTEQTELVRERNKLTKFKG